MIANPLNIQWPGVGSTLDIEADRKEKTPSQFFRHQYFPPNPSKVQVLAFTNALGRVYQSHGLVHSFARLIYPLGRVNAGRRTAKRIGRSHQEQRNHCLDSSERCMVLKAVDFRSIALGKPLPDLN